MYLDLHPRVGKYGHAAHFTVRCGCAVAEDVDSALALGASHNGFQLPVVALVMNIGMTSTGGRVLANHSDLETLLHEFGHALHSLLSRTTFQHLSGTRAASDFIETPSQLLEHFAWDHRVLTHFSEHETTGEPLPTELLMAMRAAKTQHLGIDTLQQVLLALFDQRSFGVDPPTSPAGDGSVVAAMAHQLHLDVMPSALPPAADTHWWARFTHLTSYGATYYGYLYDKALAAQLWRTLFADRPLDVDRGTVLWHSLLKPGAAMDPNEVLRQTLGGEARTPEDFF